ncbi:MAG TPA: TIGR00282 family metallophosphoesterase [Candidatus Polarisedimenticolaceae bacterium]|nr:TIGR00282 family metallophosphoesterase [Candidatus Polarisedimenticolaceae bacterium]
MRLLLVGDVVGSPGRRILRARLRRLARDTGADLTIVNGENAAGGAGLTSATAAEIFDAGAEVVTTGNHVWDKKEVHALLARDPRILRPANYPDPAPGAGVYVARPKAGAVAVVNLMGRVFMPAVDDPFRAADRILASLDGVARVVLIDFHAEATSEKAAFAWYLDGRVSAVIGTHTHVPTADARVLPGGTAFMADVGMTGPYDSVIGVRKEQAIERFRTQRPIAYETAEDDVRLAAVRVDVDDASGRATAIERIELREGDEGAP